MSRPISESLSLLSETLGNCKNNLKEKEVADVDNIKISDVDEKIAEIQAGGGGSDYSDLYSQLIEKVEVALGDDNYQEVKFGEKVNWRYSGKSGDLKVKITATGDSFSSSCSLHVYYFYKALEPYIGGKTVVVDNIPVACMGSENQCVICINDTGDEIISIFYFTIQEPYNPE